MNYGAIHAQVFLWTFFSGWLLSKNIVTGMYDMVRVNKPPYCFFKVTVSYTFPPTKHKDPGFLVSSDLVGLFGYINPA